MALLFSPFLYATPAIVPSPVTGAYPPYHDFQCSGFRQIMVPTIDDTCLGLVADRSNGLRMPRYAVQAKDGTIYISDMGSWDFATGTIWAIELIETPGQIAQVKMMNLFPKDKLTMPNGLLLDPEGRLYVGTPTGVYRFHPKNASGEFNIDSDVETIEDGFMASIFRKEEYESASNHKNFAEKKKSLKHKHPLVQLAANKDFTEIYMNVGAPSDACTAGVKTKTEQGLCVQSESPLVNAGIWKTVLSPNSERKKIKTEAVARGLRNSMGLAIHPLTQKLYQAENSMDLKDIDLPYEEINLIETGKHYGWPYCHSNDKVNEAFIDNIRPEDCVSKYSGPLINMPAHTAPLGLLFYQSNRLTSLTGKLLVSWHGYRENGQKVVAFPMNPIGMPTSFEPENIVFGWEAAKGLRPLGAPVGLTELNDGRLLIMDDKNRSVLILDKGMTYSNDSSLTEETIVTEEQITAIKPLQKFLNQNCNLCHAPLAETDSKKLVKNLLNSSMIDDEEPLKSKLLRRVENRDMPMGKKLDDPIVEDAVAKIRAFLKTLEK